MSTENIHEADGDSFKQEVLEADGSVLVDFWAPWCGPCQMLAPVLEELAEENQGSVKVVKVNVDEAQEVAADYQIQAIPTVVLFRNGQEASRQTGVAGKDDLQKMISEAV